MDVLSFFVKSSARAVDFAKSRQEVHFEASLPLQPCISCFQYHTLILKHQIHEDV